MEGDYRGYLAETDAAFQAFAREVEGVWGAFDESTQKVWSSYSAGLNGHSQVDFENGEVRLEVLVEPSSDRQILEDRLATELTRVLSNNNPSGEVPLANQIKWKGDRYLSSGEARTYVRDSLLTKVEPPTVIVGADHVKRLRRAVTIRLADGHLRHRAEICAPIVQRHASRYALSPALVMAIIHTESAFNPLARSSVPAYGLMQVVPAMAGADAYRFLDLPGGKPAAEDLYRPEHNVLVGTTYLKLLRDVYFGNTQEDEKNTHLVIAGYNCGPANVERALRGAGFGLEDLAGVSPGSILRLLESHTPSETQAYIGKVYGRMPLYR
jgi:membrane-bound lytic murein transglycosylase C